MKDEGDEETKQGTSEIDIDPMKSEEEENTKEEDDKDPKTLLSLLQSWDVETYLEQQEENKACEYFKATGSCPYQEVGCMFIHEEADMAEADDEEDSDNEEEEEKEAETRLRHRERLSARSRSRRFNEERIRRLRDLSISCS